MAKPPPTGRRILLVDDDRGLRHVLSTLLTAAGHVVASAADGPEAIGLLDHDGFDMVLLDISLPSLSGLDVLARARASGAAARRRDDGG